MAQLIIETEQDGAFAKELLEIRGIDESFRGLPLIDRLLLLR